ncbi:phosphomethylpyrimidine synthase ThiC [Thermosipho africanus]|uniref:phosphomethylpyrimidine synthase ThiC n=1 Tax=Thermosipho africanus TaxID=2421 RepID=UPI0002FB2001
MTLIEKVKNGEKCSEIEKIAEQENVSVNKIIEGLLNGKIVIPHNKNHTSLKKFMGIGEGLTVKVNANIGTSFGYDDFGYEKEKFNTAKAVGANSVMLLSTWGNLDEQREFIIENSDIPVGTVPIYDAAVISYQEKRMLLISAKKIS